MLSTPFTPDVPVADADGKAFEDAAAAYLGARNSQLVDQASSVLPKTDLGDDLGGRVSSEHERLRERRERLAKEDERYSASSTDVRLLSADRLSLSTVVARIEEATRFDYVRSPRGGPEYTAFVAERDFTFVQGSRGWILSDVRYVGDGGLVPVNELLTRPRVDLPPDRRWPPSAPERDFTPEPADTGSDPGGTVASALNYGAMVNYARKWALSYNPAFYRYPNDCTNFVSQALRTGGWTEVTGWYRSDGVWWYNASYSSWTWAGAHNWSRFALGSGRTSILGWIWNMKLADVLQIDWERNSNIDHTMMVTNSGPDGQLYLSGHSNPTIDKSLSSILDAHSDVWYYAHRT